MSQLGSGAGTFVRANNTVGYFLPAMGGLYGQFQMAAGEGATGNKYMGGRLGYAAGPLNVAGAWGKTDKTGTMIDDYTDMNFGLSYNMGFMTLMTQYSKREYNKDDQNTILLGGNIPMGAGTFKVSYVKTSGSASKWEANQISLGYVYDLSKRTSLYGHYARVKNETGASFKASGSGPATGALTGFTSTGYEFGMRHNF